MPVVGDRAPRSLGVFSLEGRIAVRHGETRYHANIAWQHEPQRDGILITTPLGQGLAELSRDAAGARLRTADRSEIAAADWQELAARVFGARLPLNDLPNWLGGRRPAVGTGWQVEYLDYQDARPDALPTLIEFRYEDIDVRLKVDRWEVAP